LRQSVIERRQTPIHKKRNPCYDLIAMSLRCLVALILVAPAFAQNVQQQRTEIITALLTTDRPEKAVQQRWICFNGGEPSSVAEARNGGMDFTPDPADSCVAALQRSAKDNNLSVTYKRLLAETGGNAAMADTLPKAIGASVLSGDGKVPIGNGKAVTVNPPMAFDAGFTVAYSEGATKKQADPEKLKQVADACLNSQKDVATCFSVGYVYGTLAFSAQSSR
jgi:hypothetical protein